MISLRPDDRVLILSIASPALLLELAGQLMDGLLVGIGTADEVYEARLALASAENVMFNITTPEEIPWREAYFSVVLATPPLSPNAEQEIRRVLSPGGSVHLLPA
jgi:hypothetical protein